MRYALRKAQILKRVQDDRLCPSPVRLEQIQKTGANIMFASLLLLNIQILLLVSNSNLTMFCALNTFIIVYFFNAFSRAVSSVFIFDSRTSILDVLEELVIILRSSSLLYASNFSFCAK